MSAASVASAVPRSGLSRSWRPRSQTRRWPAAFKAYIAVHILWLALYALLGKGFGYAGFPPLYAGEILLVPALVVPLFARRLSALLRTPLGIILTVFLGWQMVCTIPYLETFQLDAL